MLEWFVHISVNLLKNAQSSPIVPHPGIARISHGHGFIQLCGHGLFPKRGKSGMVLLLVILLYHIIPGLSIKFVTFDLASWLFRLPAQKQHRLIVQHDRKGYLFRRHPFPLDLLYGDQT